MGPGVPVPICARTRLRRVHGMSLCGQHSNLLRPDLMPRLREVPACII